MSRRTLQYRKSLKNTGREMLESIITSRHKFSKSRGRKQLYIQMSGRLVPGVPGVSQCSMPIKSHKAARLAASLRRYFA